MFLDYTNPKICISVIAVGVNLYKITELRKRQLRLKILHNLKEFKKKLFYLFFKFKLKFVSFSKNIILMNNLELKC